LVRHIANKNKPVIISTGTAGLPEVRETVESFFESGNRDLVLMQCTAAYPAPVESLNIRAIPMMRKEFGVLVGLSDHSREPLIGPLAAVALGANIVEKHFTLSNQLPGPDHPFSLEPSELRDMVANIRDLERALGSGDKVPHPVEAELRAFARRSIFATADIEPGEPITPNNVAVLRCGQLAPGLEPKRYEELIGKTARIKVTAGTAVLEEDYV
jgi:N-acetylneuraminate synthase